MKIIIIACLFLTACNSEKQQRIYQAKQEMDNAKCYWIGYMDASIHYSNDIKDLRESSLIVDSLYKEYDKKFHIYINLMYSD